MHSAERALAQLAQQNGGRRAPGALGAYLAGLHADRESDYGMAADLMAAALSRDPGNVELMHRTLVLYAVDGRNTDALQLAYRLAGKVPNHSIANLLIGVDNALAGNRAKAEDALSRLPDQASFALAKPLLQAWTAAAAGDGEAVKAKMSPLESLQGFEPLVQLHRGMMFELAELPLSAREAYEKALEANERASLRIVLRAGRFFERQAERERALELYRVYADQNPDSTLIGPEIERAQAGRTPPRHGLEEGLGEALFNMASLLSRENATELALVYSHQALRADPSLEVAQVLVAEILQRQDRSRAAIAVYERLRDSEAFGFLAAMAIAEELHELDRTADAVARLRELGEQHPQRYEPYVRIGNMMRREERFEEAASAYAQAVERLGEARPQHWTLFYFRGIALERSKRWEEAEGNFLKALELRPKQPYVMNYLAYSWVEQETNLERAQEMLREAVEQEPEDGYIVDSLGWVYYRLGKYGQAVDLLERAVELRPQDPIINDHLGDAYWRTGREREARVQWQRALSLDPEDERIQDIEEKLQKGLEPKASIGADANDT